MGNIVKELINTQLPEVKLYLNDGALFGATILLFIFVGSAIFDIDICKYFKEKRFDFYLMILFITTFFVLAFDIGSIKRYLYNHYPVTVSIFEFLRYIEIGIIALIGVAFIAIFLYWLLIVVIMQNLVLNLGLLIVIAIVDYNFFRVDKKVAEFIPYIAFLLFLYFNKDKLNDIIYHLKRVTSNIFCFLKN